MSVRAIPLVHRRRSAVAGRHLRAKLHVELLEDRSLLSAQVGLGGTVLPPDQPFTRTEVVAAIHSDQPLVDLTQAVHAPRNQALAGEVNPAASRRLFGRAGTSVVQVGLTTGADPLQVVRDLETLSFVTWAAPNYIYNPPGSPDPRDLDPNDPRYPQQYQHPLIQDNLAWDYTLGDPRVVVAVTDDGVDTSHEDLYQNIWINQGEIPASRLKNLVDVDGDGIISFTDLNDPVNQGPFKITDVNHDGRIDAADLLAPMTTDADGNDLGTGGWATGQDKDGNGYVDDLVGWSTIDHTNNPNPLLGFTHGTHVAGIAAARTNNGVGVAGVAGGATIMPIRFYGNGNWTSAVIAESFAYATDNGARIVNTSYTWDDLVYDPTMLAGLQYMYDGGVLHINSAGNNAMADPPREAVDTTLFVANTDANDHKASSSNFGWGVDLAAPGESILSTIRGGTYGTMSGTSMAAPEVVGVAALIWSLHPDWTRDQVAAQLVGTADNIDDLNLTQCNRGPCAGQLGAGRVNAFRAVTETLAPPRLRDVLGLPADGGSTSDPIQSFQVDVASVFDPATVNDPDNWQLIGAGPDGKFGTNDDVIIPLTYGTTMGGPYQIGTNRLYFSTAEPLPPDTYQFRAVSGGLADPFGTALDGDGSGKPGQDFVLTFTVLDSGSSPSRAKVGGRFDRLATALAVSQPTRTAGEAAPVLSPMALASEASAVPSAARSLDLWFAAPHRDVRVPVRVHRTAPAVHDDAIQLVESAMELV